MKIIKADQIHKDDILKIHQAAFGGRKGVEIGLLVESLLSDETARPSYSFIAIRNDTIIGHILFTNVSVTGARTGLSAQILAPLAVLPDHQGRGAGTLLINAGLDALRKERVHLVFVLGHPDYYPRCNFTPAGQHGFEAPYPIPAEHAGAWMVQELSPGILGTEKGTILCADSLNRPEHWRE